MRAIKCQTKDCTDAASWRAGTWWLCEEHARQEMVGREWDHGDGVTGWGTTRRVGYCDPEDYWTGGYAHDQWVEVTEADWDNAQERRFRE